MGGGCSSKYNNLEVMLDKKNPSIVQKPKLMAKRRLDIKTNDIVEPAIKTARNRRPSLAEIEDRLFEKQGGKITLFNFNA